MRGEPISLKDIETNPNAKASPKRSPQQQNQQLLCIHCDAPALYLLQGSSVCTDHKTPQES